MSRFIFICLIFVFTLANGDDDLSRIDSIRMEPDCTRSGGLCVLAEDCPAKSRADNGLCPEQRAAGVECCYGISIRETRCSKRGGECMPSETFCNPKLTFDRASDCEHGYKCCILVK